jgi:CheY-like chemotaxis protein
MGALRLGEVEHRFTWLSDGQEALQFLYRWGKFRHAPRPDLILLDLGLPKVDGRDVLATIKTDDNLNAIPVVVMTVSADPEDATLSRIYKVEAHLTKPVDLGKFLNVVRELQELWREDVILPVS